MSLNEKKFSELKRVCKALQEQELPKDLFLSAIRDVYSMYRTNRTYSLSKFGNPLYEFGSWDSTYLGYETWYMISKIDSRQ